MTIAPAAGPGPTAHPERSPADPHDGVPVTSAMRRWRVGLIAGGVALLGLGGLVMLQDVAPNQYLGIVIWFAGALIVHDGIIAPIVFGASLLLRRAGKRIPFVALAILQGAVVVGAMIALLVFPQILKQAMGTANPTVLPLDYTVNLIMFYGVLAAGTAASIAVYLLVVARRQKLRPPSVQA